MQVQIQTQPHFQITDVDFLNLMREATKQGFLVKEMREILAIEPEQTNKERSQENFVQCLAYVRDTYAEPREVTVLNKLIGRLTTKV